MIEYLLFIPGMWFKHQTKRDRPARLPDGPT
jgi:hypothetical protein